MKTTSLFLSATMALCTIYTTMAQSPIGVDYYILEDYQKAKEHLLKHQNENPSATDYYLGAIALAEGNVEKAANYYANGLSANSTSLANHIGLEMLKQKQDVKALESLVKKTLKANKKNIAVPLQIGRTYMDMGMLEHAKKMVSEAKKTDNKNPQAYILEGDVILAEKNAKKAGEATAKYEMATYFAPEYALGYVKAALVYENINPRVAMEKLQTAVEKQPGYIIAYGYLGKIYTQNGFYNQAIEAYNAYFATGIYTADDIERYARALYFTDNYEEAKKLVTAGLKNHPEHFVLNRYQVYIAAKTKSVEQGLPQAQKFFSYRDSSGYIAQDYMMHASLLQEAGRYDEAIAECNKAIMLETNKMEAYTEAATIARKKKDYALAAIYLRKQMDKKVALEGSEAYQYDVVDINMLGYDYYSAGVMITKNTPLAQELFKNESLKNGLRAVRPELNADSLATSLGYFTTNYSQHYLHKADSVFDILIERVPTGYSGYRFKALTKHAINPDTEVGLAKPYYEKMLEIISEMSAQTSATSRVQLEAYSYLGYYYYMKNEKANTTLYWSKVLEIEPDNKNAKLVLEDINKPEKCSKK